MPHPVIKLMDIKKILLIIKIILLLKAYSIIASRRNFKIQVQNSSQQHFTERPEMSIVFLQRHKLAS